MPSLLKKTCSSFRQARVHGGADGHLGGQGSGGDADLRCWWLTRAQLHLVQELGHQSGIVHCTYRPCLVEPTDISADKGQVVTLTCAADGSPPPSYIWSRNSDINQVLYTVHIVPALLSRPTSRRTRVSGDAELRGWRLTTAQLHLVQELRHQSGIEHCTFRPRLVEPTVISADKGQVVTLTCAADCSPPPSYIWYRNSDINQVLNTVHIVPALLSQQTSRQTRVRWWCWPALLTAHHRPATSLVQELRHQSGIEQCTYRPRLVEPPDILADKGQVVTLTCTADGSPPPNYIWYRTRTSIRYCTLYILYLPCWADRDLGRQWSGGDADLHGWRLTPARLHLVQELGHQSGIVHCPYRPRLVEPTGISADKGQVVTLACAADGSPPPSYIWYRNSYINQVLYTVHIVPALLSRQTCRRTRVRWWRWPARLTAHLRPATSGTGTRTSIRYCTLYISSLPCWADGHPRGQVSGGDADLRGWRLSPAQLHLVQELGHQSGIVHCT